MHVKGFSTITMFELLILTIFSFKSTQIELKSSIASIIFETKEAPEAHLEPCQTSINNYFCENS